MSERLPLWLRERCAMELRSMVAVTVVLLIAVVVAVHHFWSGRAQPVGLPAPEPAASATAPADAGALLPSATGHGTTGGPPGAAPPKDVHVDVSGEVRRPGVVRLPSGSRVADALRAAGGVLPGTDTDRLNRARQLTDGEQIMVGGEPSDGEPAAPGAGLPPDGAPSGPLGLNSATSEQLQALPGIGPVLAQNILDYRTRNGGFTSLDQLREVNGIGDHRFATLQPLVTP
ncbi:ComEA family DNA-binding protein [Streptomyces alkaliterrae]|uniref:ComEA family DNA-binding protein n=1 Tax=Streptomyces alkaliterrae TaxID=2213162 RepID=UPI002B21BF81|nr:ComEA family DNA-binding protein [Streptomyces alkaliterrae]